MAAAPVAWPDRFRAAVRGSALYAPLRRTRLDLQMRRPHAFPDWAALLQGREDDWRKARASADGKRILVATSLGMHHTAVTVDSLVAAALTFRGAKVDFLLCDAALPACQLIDHVVAPSVDRYAAKGPAADFCGVCAPTGRRILAPLGLDMIGLGELLTDSDRASSKAEAARIAGGDLNPGLAGDVEHGYAGALRFFGRAHLIDEKPSRQVFARYLEAALLSGKAAARLFAGRRYDAVIAHHGIYAPQGPIADAARAAGVRLVTWHPSYRAGRLIFEHGDTYHRAMIDEPPARWADAPLSASQEKSLDAYLASRTDGSQDWITFQRAAPQAEAILEKALGLSFSTPTFVMIGNVAWDARLHYPNSAYGDMTQWAADTVRWFAGRPDLQLIVRCHPGEVISSPRAADRLDDIVRAALPALPGNIKIVPPESDLNTYAIAASCRAALIYNTKMGVELTARGMPVIVAGDAWIRGKSISEDANDPASYYALLDRAADLARLDGARLDRARRYAYHFFFRRCVPVGAFDLERGWPLCSLREDAAAKATIGADPGLDLICAGILGGSRFEYDGA